MGVTAWWHGWDQNEIDKLAGSLMAGHLIECGCYVVCLLFSPSSWCLLKYLGWKTGGNFGGFQKLTTSYYDLSYPIAAIAADGTSVIQKHPNQNGMYVHNLTPALDPHAYLNSTQRNDGHSPRSIPIRAAGLLLL